MGGLFASDDSIALSKDRLYIDPGDRVPFNKLLFKLPPGVSVL